MDRNISFIILDSFSLLSIKNDNGSAVEVRLTPEQLSYIEDKIAFNKSSKQFYKVIKAVK
jgi:hypothetical protein